MRNCLERAIRQAQANDLVGLNVASPVSLPTGREGRPSKSFTVEEAHALLAAATGRRLHAYVTLSLLVGLRTEEARAALGSRRGLGRGTGLVASSHGALVRKGLAGRRAVCHLRVAF